MQYSIAEQLADAIQALNNSKPRTPTRDELVAELVAHLGPAYIEEAPARHRAEWDAVTAACKAANEDARFTEEEDAVLTASSVRIDAYAERILAEPSRGLGDIRLLADVCYWFLWNEMRGLASPDADAKLADGPENEVSLGDGTAESLIALLRAIRDMPLAQQVPTTASLTPLPKLRVEWDALAAEMLAANANCSALSDVSDCRLTDEIAAAEDEAGSVHERLNTCAERILKAEPVRSQPDLMLLGEACYWRLFPEPGGLMAPEAEAQTSACQPDEIPPDVPLEAVLALLKGVRDVGGRRHG